jgi:hypothetical protein
MKTNLSKVAAIALALTGLFLAAAAAASKVTFDNQSGRPALVKVAGPTATSVSVENGKKESVSVAPGHYYIKVRYGTPGAYAYSKGDEFDVTETATIASDITITLHKVVAGNYGSRAISEAEFVGSSSDHERTSVPPPGRTATGSTVAKPFDGQARSKQILIRMHYNEPPATWDQDIMPLIIGPLIKNGFSIILDKKIVEQELSWYQTRQNRGLGGDAVVAYLRAVMDQGTLQPILVPAPRLYTPRPSGGRYVWGQHPWEQIFLGDWTNRVSLATTSSVAVARVLDFQVTLAKSPAYPPVSGIGGGIKVSEAVPDVAVTTITGGQEVRTTRLQPEFKDSYSYRGDILNDERRKISQFLEKNVNDAWFDSAAAK